MTLPNPYVITPNGLEPAFVQRDLQALSQEIDRLRSTNRFEATLSVQVNDHYVAAAFTKVPLDTITFEAGSGATVRLATDDVLINTLGWWEFGGGAFTAESVDASTLLAMALFVNGTERRRMYHAVWGPAASSTAVVGQARALLVPGDVVDVRFFYGAAAAAPVHAGAGPLTFVQGHLESR